MLKRSCSMPGCDRPHAARELCTKHWKREHGKPTRWPHDCAGCGKRVMKSYQKLRGDRRPTCSDLCRAWLQHGPMTCQVPSSHPSRSVVPALMRRLNEPHIAGSCRVFITDCQVCEQTFATPYTVSTCSPECATVKRARDKRMYKDKRRALKKAAFVAPVHRQKIFERDRWRCHLCNRKLKPEHKAPHPRAAVIDHVIPLACGGTHEPANVRTACFMCNCVKGAGGGGEQLMLIG